MRLNAFMCPLIVGVVLLASACSFAIPPSPPIGVDGDIIDLPRRSVVPSPPDFPNRGFQVGRVHRGTPAAKMGLDRAGRECDYGQSAEFRSRTGAGFGDLGRNGRYDSFDVQQASRMVVRLDTGFQQHPQLDPVILADFNGNGQIDSFNVQQLSRLALRLPVTGVAPLPSPAPTTTDTDRLTAEEPPKKETEEADPVPISDVDMPNRLSTMLRSRSFAFSGALPNSRLVPPGCSTRMFHPDERTANDPFGSDLGGIDYHQP